MGSSGSGSAETPAAVSAVAHVVVLSLDQPCLDDHDFHHVTRVLRGRTGETITVTDGQGGWRSCKVPADWTDAATPVTVVGEIVNVKQPPVLCVAVALVKADKPELVVQKLTEIGVSRICFVKAERSVVKWDADRAPKHLARLKLVAREALMQSRGVWMPTIEGPVSLAALVTAEQAANRVVAAADYGGDCVTREVDTVLIGPEGGWSSAERDTIPRIVTLGTQILRAETAAIAAAVLLTAAHR